MDEIKSVGKKTAEINGLRVWRNVDNSGRNQIVFRVGSKITSVNNDETSKRGNPNMYKIFDDALNGIGITTKERALKIKYSKFG
jgi:hypothetical protein